MQNKKYVYMIRVVAILIAATVLYSLPELIKVIWWEFSLISYSDDWQEVIGWDFIWHVGLALLWILTIIKIGPHM